MRQFRYSLTEAGGRLDLLPRVFLMLWKILYLFLSLTKEEFYKNKYFRCPYGFKTPYLLLLNI